MMNAEHRRPFAAFLLVFGFACVVMANGLRDQVVQVFVDSGAPRPLISAVVPDIVLGHSLHNAPVEAPAKATSEPRTPTQTQPIQSRPVTATTQVTQVTQATQVIRATRVAPARVAKPRHTKHHATHAAAVHAAAAPTAHVHLPTTPSAPSKPATPATPATPTTGGGSGGVHVHVVGVHNGFVAGGAGSGQTDHQSWHHGQSGGHASGGQGNKGNKGNQGARGQHVAGFVSSSHAGNKHDSRGDHRVRSHHADRGGSDAHHGWGHTDRGSGHHH